MLKRKKIKYVLAASLIAVFVLPQISLAQDQLLTTTDSGWEVKDDRYEAQFLKSGEVTMKLSHVDAGVTLVPEYSIVNAEKTDESIVYYSEGFKEVYTINDQGVKGNVILDKPLENGFEVSWKLNLPEWFEAKLEDDGNIGIYGPAKLYGNVDTQDEVSRDFIEKSRILSPKTKCLYTITAPVVFDADGISYNNIASYELEGQNLTLNSHNLDGLEYPIKIDPTITCGSGYQSTNYDSVIYTRERQVNEF